MQLANEFNPFQNNYSINFKGVLMDFSTPRIMGIVNLTPDSFFSGSRFQAEKEILLQVEKILTEGADIIDLGAFSSQPNSDFISLEEEKDRLLSPLKQIAKEFPTAVLSIDTYRSEIAKQSIQEGASIINDISGGDLDEAMFPTIAALKVPYVMMHMKGTPKTMQESPSYTNVCQEIFKNFSTKLIQLNKLGVNDVILDVGFGFGKTLAHNYTLLKKLNNFQSLQRPILVGLSRKGMIQKVIEVTSETALNGTTAAHVLALQNGANILRVHDVKEAKEAIQIVDFYQKQ
ncbi:dihydropteroate synthase [Vicingaceae bacterium]|nr:dihydropteroate synthase [Vicingaceae bacterium]